MRYTNLLTYLLTYLLANLGYLLIGCDVETAGGYSADARRSAGDVSHPAADTNSCFPRL